MIDSTTHTLIVLKVTVFILVEFFQMTFFFLSWMVDKTVPSIFLLEPDLIFWRRVSHPPFGSCVIPHSFGS